MLTTRLFQDPPALASEAAPVVPRHSLLTSAAVAGATVVGAGPGLLSDRVDDQVVLDPDHGHAFEAWRQWRSTPGPLGAVGRRSANPHNT